MAKFTRCQKAIKEPNLSGKLEDDLICDVRDLYRIFGNYGFIFKHAFEVCNHVQTNGGGGNVGPPPILISP